MQPAETETAGDLSLVTPGDYVEWLESQERIETLASGGESFVGRSEPRSAEADTGGEAPLLAPTDYVEWLESHEGIETGTLTSPGVEPTVVKGPAEPVIIPEGG